VRERCLLTHGGGREAGAGGHFLAPFDGLVCVVAVLLVSLVDTAASASGLRIEGPLRASQAPHNQTYVRPIGGEIVYFARDTGTAILIKCNVLNIRKLDACLAQAISD
jgi:hypothetical protein